MKTTRFGLATGIALLGIVFGLTHPAQTTGIWSQPLQLNNEIGTTPFILADPSGGVHIFWGSTGSGERMGAIFYKRLVDGEWSETVDILAAPNGGAAIYPNAVIDSMGNIHLVWVSGQLFYSRVHISEALHPRNWSIPYQMTNYPVVNGVIQSGSDGSLNVLFGSQGTNPAIYLLKSEDGGDIWRIAIKVSEPQAGHNSHLCSLIIDSQGWLHAAWGEVVQTLAGEEDALIATLAGISYARSEDQGLHWSYPQVMEAGRYGEPALLEDNIGNIHLLWSGYDGNAGSYHNWLDQSLGVWSESERIFSGNQGLYGPPGLALDSAGRLYAAIPAEYHSTFTEAVSSQVVTTFWQNGKWGETTQVTGEIIASDSENGQPGLAVTRGNQLHLVWVGTDLRLDQAEEYTGNIWYSTRRVDAPQSQPVVLPTQDVPLAIAAIPTQTNPVLPIPTAWEVPASGFLPVEAMWYKEVPVIFGGVFAGIVLSVILRWRNRRKNHVR